VEEDATDGKLDPSAGEAKAWLGLSKEGTSLRTTRSRPAISLFRGRVRDGTADGIGAVSDRLEEDRWRALVILGAHRSSTT
jgi:hypothetical protein